MKIIIFGDLHGEIESWKPVVDWAKRLKPDLYLLVGDVGPNVLYKNKEAWITDQSCSGADFYRQSILETKKALDETGVPWFCVPGNHDDPNFFGILDEENIDRKLREFKGMKFYGFGGSLGSGFFPNEFKDEEIEDFEFPKADFYLLHSPPYDCKLDKTHGMFGIHIGSKRLRALLKTSNASFACGHCHEAAGIEQFYKSLGVNAGSYGDPYADTLFAVWEEGVIELWRYYNENLVVKLENQ